MRFGSKVLFDEVTTSFLAGRRYGLTGPNGSGKSTFMKLLTGEQPAQKGNVVRPKKVGVLRQDLLMHYLLFVPEFEDGAAEKPGTIAEAKEKARVAASAAPWGMLGPGWVWRHS